MKHAIAFSPKDQYYEHYIWHLSEEYKKDKTECPRYPTREDFDNDTRKELKEEWPDQVIEGEEKICGETVVVWYFYD